MAPLSGVPPPRGNLPRQPAATPRGTRGDASEGAQDCVVEAIIGTLPEIRA